MKTELRFFNHPNGVTNEYVRQTNGNLYYRSFSRQNQELLSDWSLVDESDTDSMVVVYFHRSEIWESHV